MPILSPSLFHIYDLSYFYCLYLQKVSASGPICLQLAPQCLHCSSPPSRLSSSSWAVCFHSRVPPPQSASSAEPERLSESIYHILPLPGFPGALRQNPTSPDGSHGPTHSGLCLSLWAFLPILFNPPNDRLKQELTSVYRGDLGDSGKWYNLP